MNTALYAHISGCAEAWPWPDFSPAEVACKCCGELYYDPESMHALQALRTAWGRPIRINSAHRCAAHNRAVHGALHSRHLKIAFDCRCASKDREAFIKAARAAGFRGIGRYSTFVHIDMGPVREWAA